MQTQAAKTQIHLTVGDVIKLARRKRGMSQTQLGKGALELEKGPAQAKIKKIELGHQAPTPEEVKKIAEVLNFSLNLFRVHILRDKPKEEAGVFLSRKLLGMFPTLEVHLSYFNSAAELGYKDEIVKKNLRNDSLHTQKRNRGKKTQSFVERSEITVENPAWFSLVHRLYKCSRIAEAAVKVGDPVLFLDVLGLTKDLCDRWLGGNVIYPQPFQRPPVKPHPLRRKTDFMRPSAKVFKFKK